MHRAVGVRVQFVDHAPFPQRSARCGRLGNVHRAIVLRADGTDWNADRIAGTGRPPVVQLRIARRWRAAHPILGALKFLAVDALGNPIVRIARPNHAHGERLAARRAEQAIPFRIRTGDAHFALGVAVPGLQVVISDGPIHHPRREIPAPAVQRFHLEIRAQHARRMPQPMPSGAAGTPLVRALVLGVRSGRLVVIACGTVRTRRHGVGLGIPERTVQSLGGRLWHRRPPSARAPDCGCPLQESEPSPHPAPTDKPSSRPRRRRR